MENKTAKNIGVILLAAGGSTRLGSPKQNLVYAGQTLLQHSLQVASDSTAYPIIIVLGAYADIIKQDIGMVDVSIVMNTQWQQGMASSIRSGVKALTEIHPSTEGAILMVCDQPFVTASLINGLIDVHQHTGKPIVTSGYADTFGPPTLFHKSLFPELLELTGDVGARNILGQHKNEVEVIPFPEGKIDIDTKADYQKLSEGKNEP